MEPPQFYNYTKMQYTKTAISAPTILPRQPWNSPEATPRDRTITPCSGPLRWPRKAAKHAPGSARHGGQKCSESFRPRVRKEASTLDRGCPLATAHLRYHLHCSVPRSTLKLPPFPSCATFKELETATRPSRQRKPFHSLPCN